MTVLERALERAKPINRPMRYPALLRGHVEGATVSTSRRFACVLEALQFVAGMAVVVLVATLAAHGIGHALGWAWWMAEHWKDLPQ